MSISAEDFIASKESKDGNLYPMPTDAQEGMDILIKHFLGADWCVVDPLGVGQVNTIAVYEILQRNRKQSMWKSLKDIIRYSVSNR